MANAKYKWFSYLRYLFYFILIGCSFLIKMPRDLQIAEKKNKRKRERVSVCERERERESKEVTNKERKR
jgi:hypothetical protein